MLLDLQLSLSLISFTSCHSSSQVLEYSSPRSTSFGNKVQEALEDNKKGNAYACHSYVMEVMLLNVLSLSCNTRSQVKCYLSRLSNAYAYQSINLDVWCKLKCHLFSLHQSFVSCMLEFGRVLQVHFQSSIGNSFRIEGSLVASHTPKIQIYYLALYCCTSISFSASISWFRQVNNILQFYLILWKILVPKGQAFP